MGWKILKKEVKNRINTIDLEYYKSRVITFKNGLNGLRIVSCMSYNKKSYYVSSWLFESEESEVLLENSSEIVSWDVDLKTAFKVLRAVMREIDQKQNKGA